MSDNKDRENLNNENSKTVGETDNPISEEEITMTIKRDKIGKIRRIICNTGVFVLSALLICSLAVGYNSRPQWLSLTQNISVLVFLISKLILDTVYERCNAELKEIEGKRLNT